jgi:RNA polymerase sigma-70 factor (ECF subfamily)
MSLKDQSTADFASLVKEHYEGLYKFAWSLSKNEEDAADLTQNTFLTWARKGHTLRDQAKAKSWLFTTLYREFLRQYRRGQKVSPMDQELMETREDPDLPHTARKLEGREALEALQSLEDAYREPLTLFYLEDMAYKDIAEVLDIPIGTVMSRLSRGKAQLKSILTEKKKK